MHVQLVRNSWGLSVSCFIYSFMFQVMCEEILRGKDFIAIWYTFYTKIVITLIPTNLDVKSLYSLVCPFVETKNKNRIFKKLLVW